jgi:hypothetical protein
MASEAREVWGDLAASAFVQENHLFRSLDEEARRDLVKLARYQSVKAARERANAERLGAPSP